MKKEFLSESDIKKKPLSQERVADMVEYLRQLALYRKVNYKKLNKEDRGRFIKEIHFMEKKIMQHIDLSEYLLKYHNKYSLSSKNA
jgi:hypothetical protein